MLGDLAILYTPQVIVAGGRAAKGTFADSKDEISLIQNHVNFIVHHGNPMLRQSTQRGVQTGYTIGNAAVVLDVIVTVKIVRSFVQIIALHDIIEKFLDQFTVFLGFVQISDFRCSISLGMIGGVRLSQRSQIVPMFGNLTAFVKAEDVKSDLLTGTGKIIDCLQEHFVTVLENTDVVHRGFHISRCEIFHGADKSICTSAICQIVLDVAIREQAAGGVRVSGSKGVDECQRLFYLAMFRLERCSLRSAVFRGRFGSSVLGAASGQDCSALG